MKEDKLTNPNGNGALHDFLCSDTGIRLQIRKVPFTLTDAIQREYDRLHPPPKPPTNLIDYGDEQIQEPNYADPIYVRRLREHEDAKVPWANEQSRRLFAAVAIECEVDTELVQRYRAAMALSGIALDPDDKYVFIWNIAIGTAEGHIDLVRAIQRRSGPTPEAVSESLARFRPASERP